MRLKDDRIRKCIICQDEFKIRSSAKNRSTRKLGVNRVNCSKRECTKIYDRIYRHMSWLRRDAELREKK